MCREGGDATGAPRGGNCKRGQGAKAPLRFPFNAPQVIRLVYGWSAISSSVESPPGSLACIFNSFLINVAAAATVHIDICNQIIELRCFGTGNLEFNTSVQKRAQKMANCKMLGCHSPAVYRCQRWSLENCQ